MKTEHKTKLGEGSTPGPWFDQINEHGQHCVYHADGWIATCVDEDHAKLIAKAPLLIEAREVLADVLRYFVPSRDKMTLNQATTFDQARALLAKLDAE